MKKFLLTLSFFVLQKLAIGFVVPAVGPPAPALVAQAVSPTNVDLQIISSVGVPMATGYKIDYYPVGNPAAVITFISTMTGTFNLNIGSLLPKTSYMFVVTPTSSLGTVLGTPASTTTTTFKAAPAAPTNLRIISNCPAALLIGWDQNTRPEDVELFTLQFSFNNADWNTVSTGGTGTTALNHFENAQLLGNNLWYRVIATNSTGTTASSSINVTWQNYTAPNAPIDVHSIKAERTQNSLNITWGTPDQDWNCRTNIIDAVYVYYKAPGDPESAYKLNEVLNGSAIKSTIKGLNPKQVVDFRVLFMSPQGKTTLRYPLDVQAGRDTTLGPPYAPTNLTITPSSNVVNNDIFTLNWKDNSNDETYYVVEVSKGGSSTYQTLAKLIKNTNKFVHLPIEDGVSYLYRVYAGNAFGVSSYATANAVTFDYATRPDQPTNLMAVRASADVNLTWEDNSMREKNYVVERSDDAGKTYSTIATLDRNIIAYKDLNVSKTISHYYRVKSTNPIGDSPTSNLVIVPISTSGSINDNSVSIYPNPTVEQLSILMPSNNTEYSIKILDNNNLLNYSSNLKTNDSGEMKINVNTLKAGVYLLQISNGTESTTKRIVKY